MAVDELQPLNSQDLSAVAHLARSDRYKSIMQVRSSPAREDGILQRNACSS